MDFFDCVLCMYFLNNVTDEKCGSVARYQMNYEATDLSATFYVYSWLLMESVFVSYYLMWIAVFVDNYYVAQRLVGYQMDTINKLVSSSYSI